VVLASFGDKELEVVKVVKNITGASLMDAKKLVESAPAKIKEGVSKEDAEKIKAQIAEAGGTVELK
jgi:large subunit ribosomal protein L7/L12